MMQWLSYFSFNKGKEELQTILEQGSVDSNQISTFQMRSLLLTGPQMCSFNEWHSGLQSSPRWFGELQKYQKVLNRSVKSVQRNANFGPQVFQHQALF